MERRVRLSPTEVKAIVETAKEIFGSEVNVWLFGSRTDPSRKGGDIDLYVETPEGYKVDKLIKFLAKLYRKLGERKIDVILERKDAQTQISQTAKMTGVKLC